MKCKCGCNGMMQYFDVYWCPLCGKLTDTAKGTWFEPEMYSLMLKELKKILKIAESADHALDPIYYTKLISKITGVSYEKVK